MKLTDFGIVKTIEDDPELTASGQLVGTPLYMSPEQSTGSQNCTMSAATSIRWGDVLCAADRAASLYWQQCAGDFGQPADDGAA